MAVRWRLRLWVSGFSPVPSPRAISTQKSLVRAPAAPSISRREMSTRTTPIRTSTTCGIMASSIATASIAGRCRNIGTPTAGRGGSQRRRQRLRVPSLPLSSFYNADNVLVWPGDAPLEGDLKEKRAVFDQASEAVLSETKKNGVAVDGLCHRRTATTARLRQAGTGVHAGARNAADFRHVSTCFCCRSTSRWPRRPIRRRGRGDAQPANR